MKEMISNYKDKKRRNLIIFFPNKKEFHIYDYYGIKTNCVFRIKKWK